jgi:hypothetical protein
MQWKLIAFHGVFTCGVYFPILFYFLLEELAFKKNEI